MERSSLWNKPTQVLTNMRYTTCTPESKYLQLSHRLLNRWLRLLWVAGSERGPSILPLCLQWNAVTLSNLTRVQGQRRRNLPQKYFACGWKKVSEHIMFSKTIIEVRPVYWWSPPAAVVTSEYLGQQHVWEMMHSITTRCKWRLCVGVFVCLCVLFVIDQVWHKFKTIIIIIHFDTLVQRLSKER